MKNMQNLRDHFTLQSYRELCQAAHLLWTQGKHEDAKKLLKVATSQLPTESQGWLLLSQFYIDEKDWDNGLIYFRKLIDLHPENETLMNSYGAYCFQAGKFAEAIEIFKKVNALHENHHLAQKFIAYGYRNLGDLDNSILWFKKSLDSVKREYFTMNSQTRENQRKFADIHFEYYKDLIQTLEVAAKPKECVAVCLEALKYLDPQDNILKKEMERQNIDPFLGRLQYCLRMNAEQNNELFDRVISPNRTDPDDNNSTNKWTDVTSNTLISSTMFLLPKLSLFGDVSESSSPSFILKPEPNISLPPNTETFSTNENAMSSSSSTDDFFKEINEEDIVSGVYFERKEKEKQKQQMKVANTFETFTVKIDDFHRPTPEINRILQLENANKKPEKNNRFDMYALLGAPNLRTYTKEDIQRLGLREQVSVKEPQTIIEKVIWLKTRLGHAYNLIAKPNLAVETLNEVIVFRPEAADIHFELGKAHATLGNDIESEFHLTKTNCLHPCADTNYGLAILHRKMHKFEAASIEFHNGWLLNPTNNCWFADYMYALKSVCKWDEFYEQLPLLHQKMEESFRFNENIVHPFSAIMYNFPTDLILKCTKVFVEHLHTVKPLKIHRPLPTDRNRRLKIGYVSSNFLNHAQGNQLQHYFKYHNRNEFEIYGYSLQRAVTMPAKIQEENIRKQMDHFISLVEYSDEEAAKRIADDNIDILIDCCGHVDENRIALFAYQPAPIQVEWLGYPSTSGTRFIHYYVGDKISTPPELWKYFTEKMVIMPHTYQVTEHKWSYPEVVTENLTAEHIRKLLLQYPDVFFGEGMRPWIEKDAFVFCNFNQAVKIDPETFNIWMKILKRVPNSILWLITMAEDCTPKLKAYAERCGVDPNRLVFAPNTSKTLHVNRLRIKADLLLDTPVYNAHTSAGDALWAAVPIITLESSKWPNMASRVCASMLRAAGITETIVHTFEEYEEMAVYFATHRHELKALKEKLLKIVNNCPLFDTVQYVKDFEKALKKMWQLYVDGLPPDHIEVAQL
jgi:predicted O-linked N-acetylglucosamine transferase (SPINDLY family)